MRRVRLGRAAAEPRREPHQPVGMGAAHVAVGVVIEDAERRRPRAVAGVVARAAGHGHLGGHGIARGHRRAEGRMLEGMFALGSHHGRPKTLSAWARGALQRNGRIRGRGPMPAGGRRAHFGQQQARALIRLARRSRSFGVGKPVNCTPMRRGPGSSSALKTRTTVPRIEIGSFSAGA